MKFTDYSDISLRAFEFTDKKTEVMTRKRDIVDSVLTHHSVSPRSILFVGFNPGCLAYDKMDVTVTEISDYAVQHLQGINSNIRYSSWDDIIGSGKRYDAVVAMDEFLTFADSDDEQQHLLEDICNMTGQVTITTLRDYKNQSFKDREFSVPSVIRNGKDTMMFLEYHDYDVQDRNAWTRSVFQIDGVTMESYRGFRCRQMFFKQCAKFSIDAGAMEFLVHKNVMYKSLIKKNYEHVISMKFDQDGHNPISR